MGKGPFFMDIIYDISSLRTKIRSYKSKNNKLGLVPTMGALHKGHLSLIKKSLEENDITCCSIYVNPTQFNNSEDLKKYPRPINDDIQLLKSVGCDILFVPEDKEIYKTSPSIKIDFGTLETVMEGKFRPGHFNGVGIVVSKLFNIVKPDTAYFGQKDLQQYLIIKQLVNDLSFDLELKSVPIERDQDGLAMSSRNVRLSVEERRIAPQLYQGLILGKNLLTGGATVEQTKVEVIAFLQQFPQISLEYFEVVDGDTLQEISDVRREKPVALCIAAFLGDVRLIDNLLLFS